MAAGGEGRGIHYHRRPLWLLAYASAEVRWKGAWGYVVKARAAGELLSALEAVLLGKTFVSSTELGFHRGVRSDILLGTVSSQLRGTTVHLSEHRSQVMPIPLSGR